MKFVCAITKFKKKNFPTCKINVWMLGCYIVTFIWKPKIRLNIQVQCGSNFWLPTGRQDQTLTFEFLRAAGAMFWRQNFNCRRKHTLMFEFPGILHACRKFVLVSTFPVFNLLNCIHRFAITHWEKGLTWSISRLLL